MTEVFAKQRLSGWGRHHWADCFVYRPEKRRGVAEIFAQGGQTNFLARGLGRSYNDAATNGAGGVISLLRLDRMLDFDEETGEEVVARPKIRRFLPSQEMRR